MDRERNSTHCPPSVPSPCWQFDRQRFPSGGEALVTYVQSRGLKLGLYSSAGPTTCQGRPASLGREDADALWLAHMRVEYLKYDNCGSEGVSQGEQAGRHAAMRDALVRARHPILFALCEWNGHVGDPFEWVNRTGNSWRTNGDIDASWESILYEADHADVAPDGTPLWTITGPDSGWGDADMLEVGVCHNCGGLPGEHPRFLSDSENRAHFSLWALLKSPLLAALDPANASAATPRTLTNEAVIAASQDRLGVRWGLCGRAPTAM